MNQAPSTPERCQLLLNEWRNNLLLTNREKTLLRGEIKNLDLLSIFVIFFPINFDNPILSTLYLRLASLIFTFLAIAVFGFNFLGDGINDAINPRQIKR